jgi:hypothetical protein
MSYDALWLLAGKLICPSSGRQLYLGGPGGVSDIVFVWYTEAQPKGVDG